jgi:hypothetical protein
MSGKPPDEGGEAPCSRPIPGHGPTASPSAPSPSGSTPTPDRDSSSPPAGPFPAGRVSDGEAVGELVAAIDGVVGTTRAALTVLDDADPVAHDVVVATLEGLEKSRWMLLARAG